MTLEKLLKLPFVTKWFDASLAYLNSSLFKIESNGFVETETSRAIVIVSKKHYTEKLESFPSISKKELNELLKHKKAAAERMSYSVLENKLNDGFEVRFYFFHDEIFKIVDKKSVLIPETECFSTNDDFVAEAETPAGKMFISSISGKIQTSYEKGLIKSVESFKLSAGVPNQLPVLTINKVQYPSWLKMHILQLQLPKFTNSVLFNPIHWVDWKYFHLVYWGPLLVYLVLYGGAYANLILEKQNFTELLASKGDNVSKVIQEKKTLDQVKNNIEAIYRDVGQITSKHNSWTLVNALIELDVDIIRIHRDGNKLTIRGFVDQASTVLSVISEHRLVSTASFQGAVRKSGGRDFFILIIEVNETA